MFMNKKDQLAPRDLELLAVIDGILANGSGARREDHPLEELCAHIIGTVPQAAPKFQKSLQQQLTAAWQRKYEFQTEAAAPNVTLKATPSSWIRDHLPDTFKTNPTREKRRVLSVKRSTVQASLAVLLVASLTVAFVPPLRTAVVDAIRSIVIGPNTEAWQVDQYADGGALPLPPDVWVIHTEIGGFGGNAPPGVDPIVQSVNTFEEAQGLTNYHLRRPTDLPEGFAFREAKLAPIGGTSWAILFYSGPGDEIIVAQMPGGPQPSDDPNVVSSVKSGVLTDGTLEEVDFDGRTAAWIDGHSLLWESEGISYHVGALDLSLQQVIDIARSLR
jgi:hypothetical protein